MQSPEPPRSRKKEQDLTRALTAEVRQLAFFRYNLRRFLRFSEQAARNHGLTPQQHQLLLGIAGFNGTGAATISEIAEFLQERNNSVVGLAERAQLSGLIKRSSSETDRRAVVLTLTARGEEVLSRLTALHREELKRLRAGILPPDPFSNEKIFGSVAASRFSAITCSRQ